MFHWTPRRIHAHLAIAFMAFACVRHLEHRLRLRKALLRQQCSILSDGERRYVVPSKSGLALRCVSGIPPCGQVWWPETVNSGIDLA